MISITLYARNIYICIMQNRRYIFSPSLVYVRHIFDSVPYNHEDIYIQVVLQHVIIMYNNVFRKRIIAVKVS